MPGLYNFGETFTSALQSGLERRQRASEFERQQSLYARLERERLAQAMNIARMTDARAAQQEERLQAALDEQRRQFNANQVPIDMPTRQNPVGAMGGQVAAGQFAMGSDVAPVQPQTRVPAEVARALFEREQYADAQKNMVTYDYNGTPVRMSGNVFGQTVIYPEKLAANARSANDPRTAGMKEFEETLKAVYSMPASALQDLIAQAQKDLESANTIAGRPMSMQDRVEAQLLLQAARAAQAQRRQAR